MTWHLCFRCPSTSPTLDCICLHLKDLLKRFVVVFCVFINGLSFHGWALASGYFLTGEGRGYSTSGSTFARTDATNAWEITARISDLDLSASAGAAGQILSSAVGVNFYVNPNTRIILDWTRADVATQNPVDFISLRFAVDW